MPTRFEILMFLALFSGILIKFQFLLVKNIMKIDNIIIFHKKTLNCFIFLHLKKISHYAPLKNHFFRKIAPFWRLTARSWLKRLSKFLFKCVKNNHNAHPKNDFFPKVSYLLRYLAWSAKNGHICPIMPHPPYKKKKYPKVL